MPSFNNYLVAGTVTLSGVGQASINVTLRNEATNETLAETTASDGSYSFNLAVLTSGWTVGDILSVFTLYTSYEASQTHTTIASSPGITNLNLSLAATPAVSTLRYFTGQEFYEELNLRSKGADTEEGITTDQILLAGLGVEKQIDQLCNFRFDSNSGSYYSVSNEYHDTDSNVDEYFLNYPPKDGTVSTVQITRSGEGSSPSWTTLTVDTDYVVDSDTGRVAFLSSNGKPSSRRNGLRATYTYGLSTVPKDIKKLAVLMTARELMKSTAVRALITGRNEYSSTDFSLLDFQIQELLDANRVAKISST